MGIGDQMSELARKHRFSFLLVAIAVLSVTLFSAPAALGQSKPNAKDLLRQMTLEEKIAQLSQIPGFPVQEFKE